MILLPKKRIIVLYFVALAVALSWSTGCNKAVQRDRESFSTEGMNISVGSQPVVHLSRIQSGNSQPQILGAYILPGRAMNIYQLEAYLPGKGIIHMFRSPSLEAAKENMTGGVQDSYGEQSYFVGGAILLPYANRIRGRFLPDEDLIATSILGRPVELPASGKGKAPGAERCALHGLFLRDAMDTVTTNADTEQASVTGTFNAGDFKGHWLSKTQLSVTASLMKDSFVFTVTAKNVGNEALPMGISWHPYFELPSGNREQTKIYVPARKRLCVNNYDDVFPTGQVEPVQETAYDFLAPEGRSLGKLSLDDCFVDLIKPTSGQASALIVDPAAKYGVRVTALSPEIQAIQIAAPVNSAFIALEPQFHWTDPFSAIWGNETRTGMVILKPGEAVSYSVKLELFTP